MIQAPLLILDSTGNWEKIAKAQRGYLFICLLHLLPLLVITIGLEVYALIHLGERRGITDQYSKISELVALRYGAVQFGLNLLLILCGAKLVQKLANNFNAQHTYHQCFTALAYGLSPLFLGRILDAVPFLNSWACFGIGMMLSVAVLYQGIPLLLKPDYAKALGLYFVTVALMSGLAAAAHLLALLILHEKINAGVFDKIRHVFGL